MNLTPQLYDLARVGSLIPTRLRPIHPRRMDTFRPKGDHIAPKDFSQTVWKGDGFVFQFSQGQLAVRFASEKAYYVMRAERLMMSKVSEVITERHDGGRIEIVENPATMNDLLDAMKHLMRLQKAPPTKLRPMDF